jgi:O-acetyl-ADP-ribose deacetylase (regulator of RNase III)
MIQMTEGNLLDARAEALVNTVNTVGVMGKGLALMFKERFPANFHLYAAACRAKQVQVGEMFVTQTQVLGGPRWIINFPTKQHWRAPSRMEWIVGGLGALRRFLTENDVKSVAIPPLGTGQGGLSWEEVHAQIEVALGDLQIDILLFAPTKKYQNVSKRAGVEELTPARALIAELVRRYWVLGMECSLLEVQKIAWFLEKSLTRSNQSTVLDLRFEANKYGPYSDRLRHLLDKLDGSYLHCDKRLSDASPLDVIRFEDTRKLYLQTWLKTDGREYLQALEETTALMDGFESPFGMELLATVDWLLTREHIAPELSALREGLRRWPGGSEAAARKDRLFDDRVLEIALRRLSQDMAEAPLAR